MKLYSFSGSCALAANIVLEWTGQPYDLELLDKADLASESFRKINPLGKVPALEDGGYILFENAAILGYLAENHPEAKLYGESLKQRAETNRWLGVVNSDLHPAYKPLFGATAYLEDQSAIDKTKEHAQKEIRRYFSQIDQQLDGKDWVTGQRSIVDAYLFVTILWAGFLQLDISDFANINRFKTQLEADTGVQKALKAQKLA